MYRLRRLLPLAWFSSAHRTRAPTRFVRLYKRESMHLIVQYYDESDPERREVVLADLADGSAAMPDACHQGREIVHTSDQD